MALQIDRHVDFCGGMRIIFSRTGNRIFVYEGLIVLYIQY